MGIVATQLHPLFAARLEGVDMRRPGDATLANELVAMMDRYAVCAVGHDQAPTNEEQIAFSALLGPMDRGRAPKIAGTGIRVPHNEMVDQSNLDQDGNIYAEGDRRLLFKRANRLWHTDMSFRQVRATYSLLSAHVLPPTGGNTEFIDMRAVYEALPEKTKAGLEGLTAEHSYWYSRKLGGGPDPTDEERAGRPPAYHPVVHVCPRTGRKSLYIASHVSGIVGWERGRRAQPRRRADGFRDAAALRLQPRMAARRRGHLGQPRHPAPRHAVRRYPATGATCAAPPAASSRCIRGPDSIHQLSETALVPAIRPNTALRVWPVNDG